MSSSFNHWLEQSLSDELDAAYAVPAVPALARYRQLRQRASTRLRMGKILLAAATMVALGTAGAEAAGYGPLHVGPTGVYFQVGTPATPNPPVVSPTLTTPRQVTTPRSEPSPTGEREVEPSARASAEPSESPEREGSVSPSGETRTSGSPTGASPEPSDN